MFDARYSTMRMRGDTRNAVLSVSMQRDGRRLPC